VDNDFKRLSKRARKQGYTFERCGKMFRLSSKRHAPDGDYIEYEYLNDAITDLSLIKAGINPLL